MADLYIFNQINNLAGNWPWLDAFGIFCAKYLGYILAAAVFLFLFKNWRKYWRIAVYGFGAAILARLGFTEIIRLVFPKSRPFINNNVHLLLKDMDHVYHSFPSGHASFFFGLSTVVYFYNKKVGALFLISSFLICLGRVFVGVHWPSDVTVGAIVGIFSGWLVFRIFRRF